MLMAASNPLLEFPGLPRFDAVEPAHVTPAVDELLTNVRATIEAVAMDSRPPTWENVVVPLAEALDRFDRAWSAVRHLNAVVNTPALRDAFHANLPKVSAFYAELGQDVRLFGKYRALKSSPAFASLDGAQCRMIDNELRDFRLGGAELSDDGKARFRAIQVPLYAIPYFVLVYLLSVPLNLYENFYREHQYGFATQTFAPWFREQLIGLGLTLIIGTILLIVLYAVFRRASRTWWIWGTGVAVIFLSGLVFIAPVYIEPLFNTYKPLTKPEIRDPILAMARANEIPVKQVFEVDASRQTTRVSANVSGFLGTTRIALNDNLLKQCTLPETREVMAHEMGHYVLNHDAKLLTYSGIFILIGLALTRNLFEAAVRRWGDKWGVRGIADLAGLPLLALILSAFVFVLTPLLNTVVRVTEREADAFGINTAREPDGMAKVALKLGAYRKLDPTPLEEFIFYDHPSGRARIRMAMDWKAANLPAGESAAESGTAIH